MTENELLPESQKGYHSLTLLFFIFPLALAKAKKSYAKMKSLNQGKGGVPVQIDLLVNLPSQQKENRQAPAYPALSDKQCPHILTIIVLQYHNI